MPIIQKYSKRRCHIAWYFSLELDGAFHYETKMMNQTQYLRIFVDNKERI